MRELKQKNRFLYRILLFSFPPFSLRHPSRDEVCCRAVTVLGSHGLIFVLDHAKLLRLEDTEKG